MLVMKPCLPVCHTIDASQQGGRFDLRVNVQMIWALLIARCSVLNSCTGGIIESAVSQAEEGGSSHGLLSRRVIAQISLMDTNEVTSRGAGY